MQKRLAVHVEDHPLSYADFEGTIPAGNYGAGAVIVWDRGTFGVTGDGTPSKQLADGRLHLVLAGEKLRGATGSEVGAVCMTSIETAASGFCSSASRIAAMCRGDVPQQPPTISAPPRTKRRA